MPSHPSGARPRTAAVLALLTASIVPAASVVPAASASSAAHQIEAPVPQLEWVPCGPSLEDFLCTTAEVPTDYDEPNGATTTITLTKLPATDPGARIGTLFTNPGGPGGSGVSFVWQLGKTAYTDDVRAHFDILGFDPRGVARSDPATCYRSPDEEQEALGELPAFPVTDAEQRRFFGQNIRFAVSCRITSPDRFARSSTANVARDMDVLRQAVGDERLTYMGYSYGSFLGATYAKLFPDRVRGLAVDGTIVPEDYAGEPGQEDTPTTIRMRQGRGGSETFDEFLRLCAEAGPGQCTLAALGDPATVVEETFERLKSEPAELQLPDGTTIEITYTTAVASTFSALYEPAEWTALGQFLAQLAVGTSQLTGTAADLAERSLPEPAERRRRGEDYASAGGALASACMDTGTIGEPRRYDELADAADRAAPHFGRYRTWVALPCEYLRITDDDVYTGPWEQDVDEPVLVIGTRFDPATPYAGTEPYAEHFPDARVLTVDGYGHTVLGGKSSCADQVIGDYLVHLDAPAHGSTCDQDVVPFRGPAQLRDGYRPEVFPAPDMPRLTP